MRPSSNHLYPLLFAPTLKSYIWGGRNMQERLGRELPAGPIAESWEIAAHEDGASIVTNGLFAGQSLAAVHDLLGIELIGRRNLWAQERGKFPLLVKLLDATDKLSVQVHPDDSYALAHEGNELGKTEMWVVLHARPGAEIILGIRLGTTPHDFRTALLEGTLERYLHRLPVKSGDHICVPSGTLHAIMDGILIAEIQQNSNTTYRIFDWNRVENGTPRALHIDKAMDVINFGLVEPTLPQPTLIEELNGVKRSLLCRNRYFTTERIEFGMGTKFTSNLSGESMEIWGAIEGEVNINEVTLRGVRFALLPALLGPMSVTTRQGATCLRVYVENFRNEIAD